MTIPPINQVITTSRVNLRQGAATTHVPILRTVEIGTVLAVRAQVTGEAVSGNAHWYEVGDAIFVWSGGCGPLKPAVAKVMDLSHNNTVTSFATARAAGLVGVIHKATTGATGHDPLYASRRADAIAAGLLWGAYHWGTAATIANQVANFLNIAQPDAHTLVALDYEETAGNQMTLAGARDFLQRIQTALGRRAVLYSGITIKNALGATHDAFFGGHRLWLAQYGTAPSVQASWTKYWLWQYTDGTAGPDPKTVPGIPGNTQGHVDCDYYTGLDDQLRAEWAS